MKHQWPIQIAWLKQNYQRLCVNICFCSLSHYVQPCSTNVKFQINQSGYLIPNKEKQRTIYREIAFFRKCFSKRRKHQTMKTQ